ncbi:MAG: zf-HC2 domain-containing protein [Christensenellaceae bacterium]|jgi:hypothetical protein
MECEKYREQISIYIDGELEEESYQLLITHVEECTTCKTFLTDCEEMRAMLESVRPAVPSALIKKAVKACEAEKKKRWRLRSVGLVASAAVLLVSSVYLLRMPGGVLSSQQPAEKRAVVEETLPVFSMAPEAYMAVSVEKEMRNAFFFQLNSEADVEDYITEYEDGYLIDTKIGKELLEQMLLEFGTEAELEDATFVYIKK